MGLMRLSSAVCHIGEVRAVVFTGRMPLARDFLPDRSIDCGKTSVALGPGVHFGDLQTVGAIDPLCVDFDAPDHGDFACRTPQRGAERRSASPRATARASANELVTTAPGLRKPASRVPTMLVRPGSGRPIDTKV